MKIYINLVLNLAISQLPIIPIKILKLLAIFDNKNITNILQILY